MIVSYGFKNDKYGQVSTYFAINRKLFPSVLGSPLSIFFYLWIFNASLHKNVGELGQADELVEVVEGICTQHLRLCLLKEIAFTGECFNRRIQVSESMCFTL